MAQVSLVEDVERGALGAGQLDHVDATDEEVIVANLGGHGQNSAEICSGAHIGRLIGIECRKRHAGYSFCSNVGMYVVSDVK